MASAVVLSGCAAMPWVPTPTPGEQMPGFASVWLTSLPAAPASAVEVVMTSPDDAGIRFAHTFAPARELRGSFATSEGRYTLSALRGACTLALVLGPDEEADVVLTLGPGPGCALAVTQRGRMGDPAMQKFEDAVLITNHDAGSARPYIEPPPASGAP